MHFTQNQAFSSPSAAAANVSGRPTNGRTIVVCQSESQDRRRLTKRAAGVNLQ